MLKETVSRINDIVWSPALVGLLIFAGLYFTFRTRFVQVRLLKTMVKTLFHGAKETSFSSKGVSSFQAFCMALSSRVGTGNIVGVATALAFGGPGAIFWMWIIAFFGAATAFVESTLSQIYRFNHRGVWRGGPASYIEGALKKKWLAVLFAVFTVIGYGTLLTTVQANGAASAFYNTFNIDPLVSGIVLAVILAIVIIGGVKRIANVASVVTPIMSIAYIIMAIAVLCVNYKAVPAMFVSIVTNAFAINPLCGGIIGTTIMMGVKRGLFSNEAGQGGGAIASASAEVRHPAEQGLAQAFSVYVDTILVCTATALMILSTGMFNVFDSASGEMIYAGAPELGNNYVGFTQAAIDTVFTGFGGGFVSVALLFFVFTTVMAYYFYAESSIIYICQSMRKPRSPRLAIWIYRILFLAATVFGAAKEADVIWQMGDIGVGLTTWINVIVILIIAPQAFRSLKDYEQKYLK